MGINKVNDVSHCSTPDSLVIEEANNGFANRTSPWSSLWMSIGVQLVVGVQISVYFMSMWPYLAALDNSASMDFLGWVLAACSIGCTMASPIFGYWNQKTLGVANPTVFGMVLGAIGQLMYGFLPLVPSNRKWVMIACRFVTGCGVGCQSIHRAYLATATVPDDRMKAIAYGTAGFVLGLSIGPAIQAAFSPIDEGTTVAGGWLVLNMYTLPAFLMFVVCILTAIAVKLFFREEYAGILEEDAGVKNDADIPPYDTLPALICIYLWTIMCIVSTNIEVISTPLTMTIYGWSDTEAVWYNGMMQSSNCLISVVANFAIGTTAIGRIDKRILSLFGLSIFIAYHVAVFPWPFYEGPIKYAVGGNASTNGGCDVSYTWCLTTTRVPLGIYAFCTVIFFGVAFPFVSCAAGTLYSEILGPRRQGFMQGLFSSAGSAAQLLAPIVTTFLFQRTGYRYVMLYEIVLLSVGMILVLAYRSRLVPLNINPK